MIIVAIVRGLSAIVYGIEDQRRFFFLVQLEASISVIFICPATIRSYFLIRAIRNKPTVSREWQRHLREDVEMEGKPILPSIQVGATLNGMAALIRDYGQTQVDWTGARPSLEREERQAFCGQYDREGVR